MSPARAITSAFGRGLVQCEAPSMDDRLGRGGPGGVTAAARLMKALFLVVLRLSDRSTPIARPPLSSPRASQAATSHSSAGPCISRPQE